MFFLLLFVREGEREFPIELAGTFLSAGPVPATKSQQHVLLRAHRLHVTCRPDATIDSFRLGQGRLPVRGWRLRAQRRLEYNVLRTE